MAVPKFEYFPTRAAFDTARGATTVFNNSVVFIEDTMELFTHGHFWTVSNLSQYYNSATQKLQLKNGSTVISELDASPFIKDGMLESVELITTPEGSSAVLSVNGTNYPIEVLDADTFVKKDWTDNHDTSHEAYLFPQLNENKAYIVTNIYDEMLDESHSAKYFGFTSQGNFKVKFAQSTEEVEYEDVVAVVTSSTVETPSEYEPQGSSSSDSAIDTNTWVAIPATSPFITRIGEPYSQDYQWDTSTQYYGLDGDTYYDSNVTETLAIQNATETTSSVPNSNYPAVPYLKFTFNTFDGEPTHTVIRVSISELFTVYNGDNVLLSNNYAKAQTYVEPAVGDKVDIAVGKLAKGVADNAAAIATKQATITGAATTITSDNLTASKALVSDANGKVAVSSVTSTELGYLSGVTRSIQTQLNEKANIADLGWVEH